jgi:phosphohistidine phosphatase SixA
MGKTFAALIAEGRREFRAEKLTMVIIVLRHGLREKIGELDEYVENSLSLSRPGIGQVRQLGKHLKGKGINPEVYYTSCFSHARETADILRAELANASAKVIQICSLTPHYQGPREFRETKNVWTGLDILRSVDKESRARGQDIRELATVAMILHKPRVEQLLAGMTSKDDALFHDIEYASGRFLKAESFDDVLQGSVLECTELPLDNAET